MSKDELCKKGFLLACDVVAWFEEWEEFGMPGNKPNFVRVAEEIVKNKKR